MLLLLLGIGVYCAALAMSSSRRCVYYSVRLVHPSKGMPGGEIRSAFMFLCSPWATDIMNAHVSANPLLLASVDRGDDDLGGGGGGEKHKKIASIEELKDGVVDMCLHGLQMADFWIRGKLESLVDGWTWYAHVDRAAAGGAGGGRWWGLTLLLDGGEDKTAEDAEDLSRKLWLAYKRYFGWRWVVKQPGRPEDTRKPEVTYGDSEYERRRGELMMMTTSVVSVERGGFGRAVDDRMTAMPRMGEVCCRGTEEERRQQREGDSGFLLWCHTNDADEERKASTVRLWYPPKKKERQKRQQQPAALLRRQAIVRSVRLTHPRLAFPGGEMAKPFTVYNPWADEIVKKHLVSGGMLRRIRYPDEWGEMAPDAVDFLDLQDLGELCLDGLHMVQFWLDCGIEALLSGWTRWYAYVDRAASVGSRLTLLLEAHVERETTADACGGLTRSTLGLGGSSPPPGSRSSSFPTSNTKRSGSRSFCVTFGTCARTTMVMTANAAALSDGWSTS